MVTLALLLPVAARAQHDVLLGLTAAHADHRVDAGYGPETSVGTLLGWDVRLRVLQGLTLTTDGRSGRLTARTGGAVDREMTELGVGVEFMPLPWLALQSGFTRRSYSSIVARQRWTLLRLGAEARVPFSGDELRGVGRITLLPGASVNGLPRPDLAFEGAAGLAFTRGHAAVHLTYSLERCDFPTQGSGRRSEQLSTLSLGLGWRL